MKLKLISIYILLLIIVISMVACDKGSIFEQERFDALIKIEGVEKLDHVSSFKIHHSDNITKTFVEEEYNDGVLIWDQPFRGETQLNLAIDDAFDDGIYIIKSGVDKSNSFTVSPQERNANIIVEFKTDFEINTSVVGKGKIIIEPEQEYYTYGDEVRITVELMDDYKFAKWSGDLNGTNDSVTVTVDKDLYIQAYFDVPSNINDENLETAIREILELNDDDHIFQIYFNEITELDLSGKDIEDISNLADLGLNNLEVLNLSNNNISSLEGINLNSLKSLDLSDNGIETLDGINDKMFDSLEILSLSNNKITNLTPLANANLRNLKKLYLANNGNEDDKIDLSDLKDAQLNSLEILDLSDNAIPQNNIDDLVNAGIKNLKTLNFSGNSVANYSSLKQGFNNLRELDISNNGITNPRLNDEIVSNLEILDLSENQIDDQNLTNLPLASFSNLKVLNLSSNGSDRLEIHYLFENADFENLESLDLSNNNIENILVFEEVDLKNLISLDLSDNKISDLSVLKDANFIQIEYLNLSNNKITSLASIDDAYNNNRLSNLIELDLRGNNITEEDWVIGMLIRRGIVVIYDGDASEND
ncbi:leucine-rich repeat domain-containing protein [Natronospora cellulosivora (SeqCode)]